MDISKRKFSINVLEKLSPQAKRLVEETVWGTKGGLRYHNKEVNWARLSNGYRILTVDDPNGQVVLVLVCERTQWGYYLAAAAARLREASVLRLERDEILSFTPKLQTGQTLATIFVRTNRAALLAAKLYGLKEVGSLESIPFTRRLPKASKCCRTLAAGERSEILSHLESLGRGWQDAESSLITDEYSVYEKGGRILAGVQACPQNLLLASLGSTMDTFTLAIMPMILGKNAADFQLVQLHHFWGKKELFSELWSHVLHTHGVCMAQIAIDPRDPLFDYIRYGLRRGMASHICGIESFAVYGKGAIPPRPIAVSPLMGTFV